ncbi:MAG TPA: GNAT family N-acyltransferase [Saprospiraceae bacterium]|nr:GNAT family N-acyltransferase [Saprospiraceae bacterium]
MNYSNFITADSNYQHINMDNISPAPDTLKLQIEVDALKAGNVILKTYPYVLLVCELNGNPALRQELGRQREMTFRNAGESTGMSLDIDRYDDYYSQLIIWDESTDRLVGGYRFGPGDKIYQHYGREGFYIHSFFDIDPAFDQYLPYCLELGRSFVVRDYQKKNLPLYLLWKGILAYQITHPRYKYLIGPVSISRYYSDFSRKVLMEYAKRHLLHPAFSKWFHPRTPYDPFISKNGMGKMSEGSIQYDFENILDEIRPEHIQFPILMKQYIRQNARFLGFNLDPGFNDALDGLMILDIADVPVSTIELLQREM